METKIDRYYLWYDDAAQEFVEKKCVNGKYCLYSDVEKLLIKETGDYEPVKIDETEKRKYYFDPINY